MTHLGAHLGDRVAALADGELGHEERDRALAHVAHCARCHAELEEQRAVRALLSGAVAPAPDAGTVEALLSLSAPGGPLPPRARTMPQGPVVPVLPPPGRFGRAATGPRGRAVRGSRDTSRPGTARAGRSERSGAGHRARVVTAGALSVAGLVLGTAFVAGGSAGGAASVTPPVARLTVEHGRTATGFTIGDPALGLMTGLREPVLAGTTGTAGSPGPSGR